MTPIAFTALIDATWPASRNGDIQGWTIRTGEGGGSRVSAATATTSADIGRRYVAEDAMRNLGQPRLFMIREGEDALDAALAEDGYVIKDPVTLFVADASALATQRPKPATCFEIWPPVAAQKEIWSAGGIDSARLAIMDRAKGPKTSLLGRVGDTPAGTAFAALYDRTAMLHAIETLEPFRRQGLGRNMVRALAFWAQSQGAQSVSLLVTNANAGAKALYRSLGMIPKGGYHYRIHPEP